MNAGICWARTDLAVTTYLASARSTITLAAGSLSNRANRTVFIWLTMASATPENSARRFSCGKPTRMISRAIARACGSTGAGLAAGAGAGNGGATG